MNKRIIWAALTGLMVPYVGTLAWTGTIRGEELRYEQQKEISGRRRILFGPDQRLLLYGYGGIPARSYCQADTGGVRAGSTEAQAIIARTYICRQMEAPGMGRTIAESALDMDYLEADQLKKLWGSSRFPEYYKKLEDAVKATSGIVMTYEGKCIDPMYCRATAGMTRQGDFTHPYLQTVDCPGDVEAEGYMQMLSFSRESFVSDINSIPAGESGSRTIEASQVPDTIQIVSRDDAGYVDTVQIGSAGYTGEEVQYALGLAPPALCWSPMRTESGQW